MCEAIASESGGNPYFIEALARRRLEAGHCGQAAPAISLDDVLWLRAEQLPEPARRLLHVVAVAGHPLRQLDACEAAGVAGERHEALSLLRAARLLRTGGEGLEDQIEAYHDRVREAVVRRLAVETVVDCHRRLAHTLENSGRADAAELAAHFAAAGEDDRASVHYVAAAAQAAEALAFDNAAALYQRAFASCDRLAGRTPANSARGWRMPWPTRGAEPRLPEQYLIAAGEADAEHALELTRRAATQLLVSGHIDRGIAVLREVMSRMGMRLAKGPKRALLLDHPSPPGVIHPRFVFLAARQAARRSPEGLGEDRHLLVGQRRLVGGRSDLQSPTSRRAACCWRFAPVNRSGSRGSLRFTRSRWPRPVLLPEDRATRIAERAKAIAQAIGSAHAAGLAAAAEGIVALFAGRWKQSVESLDEAQQMLRDQCTGVWWELDIVEGFALSSLFYSGQVAELTRRLPAALAAAQSRGDLLAITRLGTIILPSLAADDPDEAQRQVEPVHVRVAARQVPDTAKQSGLRGDGNPTVSRERGRRVA